MDVEDIIAALKENPQLRVAECLVAWTHGVVE
jgi:hypothetical protein